MKEITTLLLTTTFLALGGLGIYFLKTQIDYDDDTKEGDNSEEIINLEKNYPDDDLSYTKTKTKRNRKKLSVSKRRY
jgi:hypothetical protein